MKWLLLFSVLLLGSTLLLPAQQATTTPTDAPPTADDLLKQGEGKLREQDWPGAVQVFNQALELQPNLDMAYVGRGEARLHTDETEEARRDFDLALRLNGNNPYAYADRALLRNDAGQVTGALLDLDRALQLYPPWPEMLFFRGMTYLRENRWAEAQADFHTLYTMDPNDARWHIGYGLNKRAHGDLAGAMAEFNLACEPSVPLLSALLNRAQLHEELGEWNAAGDDLGRALAIAPDEESSSINTDLGLVEWQSKQPIGASLTFRKACALAGGHKPGDYPHFFLWLIGQEQHDPEADAGLKAFLTIHAYQRGDDWVGKIGAFLLGQITEEDFFKAAQTPGDEEVPEQICEVWYYAGMKKLLAGNQAEAIRHFQQCVAQKKIFFLENLLAEGELRVLVSRKN